MRRLSDVLNLFTPKKPKKKFCAEEEEDLNLATPIGVRKVNGKTDKEVEASKSNKEVKASKLNKGVEAGKSDKEVEVGKSHGAKCTSPPRVQVEKVEKILSQHPL